MFQIRGFIVFCGLLALPSPVDLSLVPLGIADSLTKTVNSGLLSGGLLDGIKKLPLVGTLKTDEDTSGGPIGKLLQQVINPLRNLTGIEITRPKLLGVGFRSSDNEHRFFLNIPLSFDVKLRLLMLKLHQITLSVKLNATVEVLSKENENGTYLVLGDCSQAPVSLEISLPRGIQNAVIQGFINKISSTLSKAIPKLVLDQVCSLINEILSSFNVSLVQNIIDELISRMYFDINV